MSVVTVMSNIESERQRYHLTQAELCKVINVPQSTFSLWKKNGGDIPVSVMMKCMALFKCSADYLMRGVGTIVDTETESTEVINNDTTRN